MWAQFFRHVRSHLVGTGLLCAVGGSLVIGHSTVIAGVDDEPASVRDEQRRRMVGGDEVRPEPDGDQCRVAEQLTDAEADVAVPTLIISNDEVMLDSPLPLRGLIDGLGQVHLPRHAEQLAALAA